MSEIDKEIIISELFNTQWVPTDMLVVYRAKATKEHADGQQAYIEHHPIADGKPQACRPLTESTLRAISHAAADKKSLQSATLRYLMPENILLHDSRLGRHLLAWYEPPQLRTFQMTASGARENRLARNHTVPFPALLYVAKDKDFYVFGLKTGKKRPGMNTPLFKAPLFNMYHDSRSCMGSIITHTAGIDDVAELKTRWLKSFWGGRFTGEIDSDPCKTALPKLFRSLKGKKQFPLTELVPANIKNINQLLRSI